MAKTGAGLAAFCLQALGAGMGYVYGAYGQVCSQSLRKFYASQFPGSSEAGEPMYSIAAKWDGRRVADCSGLVSYYLAVDIFGQNPSSRPYFHYTLATQIAPISSLPEVPGTILWKPGHVGVYMGNGSVIEAQSTANGVVRTSLPAKWQKWYWPQQIDYSGNQVFIDNPELNPQNFVFLGGSISTGNSAGARGRGYLVQVQGSIRQVYETLLQAAQTAVDFPAGAMNGSLQSSTGSVGSANNRVDPDPGEGYISGNTSVIGNAYNELRAKADTLESNIMAFGDLLAELTQRVNKA